MDGAGINQKEQQSAKEAYIGKLTIELLGERIGHFAFKNITELDLRNCKIKEVDCLSKGEFKNLRKLNFDNNHLTNIDCFTSLTGLRCLSLNNNKLEKLLSSDPISYIVSGSGLIYGQNSKIDISESTKLTYLLPMLEELNLGNNLISRISDLYLYRMKNLKVLYLHGNKISKVFTIFFNSVDRRIRAYDTTCRTYIRQESYQDHRTFFVYLTNQLETFKYSRK